MALQVRRPLVQCPDDALADRDVVLHVVELRRLQLPEEDLVRVGDLDGAAADLQFHEGRRHVPYFTVSRG
jgi:hypothetical protein